MKLHSLALTNFRQHADTRVEFGTGVTGIIGPNGSGKSTMLEAIAWALYGNEAARGRRDGIRFLRADAKAPVRVELDFELAGHRYRIVRGLSSAELYLDGADAPIANSITSVGQMVHRRVGMSRAEFFNTYFTGQKELALMAALGPSERAQFLSRVLGYERLRAAQELVREQRRVLTGELTGLHQGMPDRDTVVREAADAARRHQAAADARAAAHVDLTARQAALDAITPRWEAAQRAREERQRAMAELRLAEQELASHVRDRARAEAEVTGAADAVAELARLEPELVPFESLLAERDQLALLAREEGRRQSITDAIHTTDEDLKLLSARLETLVEAPQREEAETLGLEGARRALRDADAAHTEAHTDWIRDRQEADTRRQELLKQYRELEQQRDLIVEAGEDGICPTCQRPLGANFRGVLDMLDAQLDSVRIEGNYFRGRLEQLATAPPALAELEQVRTAARNEVDAHQRRIATVQADVRALRELERDLARKEQHLAGLRASLATLPTGYDAARHDHVVRELERLEPLHIRVSRLQATAERGVAARAELAAAVAAATAAGARVDALRAAVGGAEEEDRAFEALRRDHQEASDAFHGSTRVLDRCDAEVTSAAEALKRARAAVDELERREARLGQVTRERRLHDELDKTFSDLRTDLNAVLRPELSKVASDFLAELTDNRYSELDLDDQYNVVVVEDGSPKPVISGGEEDLANLVMRLAISQMIAERAGQAFSLLILDEVFGALDENRRQHVLDLFRGLQTRFEQVVLITHIETIRDGCDHVLSVRYDPGTGASVVQAVPAGVDAELVGADV